MIGMLDGAISSFYTDHQLVVQIEQIRFHIPGQANESTPAPGNGAERCAGHTTPFSTAKRVAALRELTWSLP